jgi:hypothetical protein
MDESTIFVAIATLSPTRDRLDRGQSRDLPSKLMADRLHCRAA